MVSGWGPCFSGSKDVDCQEQEESRNLFVALGVFIVACLAYAMFIADTMKIVTTLKTPANGVFGVGDLLQQEPVQVSAEDKSQHLNVFGLPYWSSTASSLGLCTLIGRLATLVELLCDFCARRSFLVQILQVRFILSV